MRVLACVVSWETAAHLPHALAALTGQSGVDVEVVVVDNASRDGSAEVARRFDGVRVIANAQNRGFAGAANQAVTLARHLGCDLLTLCNPDAVPAPDHLAVVTGAFGADERRAAVQGRLWRSGGAGRTGGGHRIIDTTGHLAFATRLFRNRGEGEVDRGQYDTPGPVFGVSGALATYRLAALDDVAINGEVFDETLFAFWEDVDLDWRLALRGWDAWYEPAATAWHERGGAGPRRSAVVERLNFANRLLVIAKNDDPRALWRAFPGVATTTLLKGAELGLTVPSALVKSFGAARLIPEVLADRRLVQARATVDPAGVVARWFAPFDYGAWVRTWWRRVRGQDGMRLPVGPNAPS